MPAIQPVVMVVDEKAKDYAESYAPVRQESNGPPLHATDEMHRFATPWAVARAKSTLLESCNLEPGIILDPACGSGTQLAALCAHLHQPGLGVELSGAVAPLAAINLERCGDWVDDGRNWSESSRILWGNGIDANEILQTYREHTDSTLPISLLHVDPARPSDAQQHSLGEMQPPLDQLLSAWAPLMSPQAALILDLSPRLLDSQRDQVTAIVSTIWPNAPMTWQWMTQGRGRIDRLSLWVGPAADSEPNRLVRLNKNGEFAGIFTGQSEPTIANQKDVELGEHLTIADPCLIASGLAESWKKIASMSETRWDVVTGRRPTLISSEPILSTFHDLHVSEKTHETIFSFVQISGEVIAHIPELEIHLIPEIAQIAGDLGLSSLKLRCTLNPELQPKLQSTMDREMRSKSQQTASNPGFIAEANNRYLICKEHDLSAP